MKTLIVNPPCEEGFDRSGRWPAKGVGGTVIEPLFPAYAAAVLEKEGLDVELIDCRPFYMTTGDLLKKFDKNVGLAILQTSTPSINQDLETARKIKENFSQVKIALVGPHVSVLDREILEENKFIDFICRGEYEYIVRDLAQGKNPKDISGLTFRNNKEIIRNPNRPYIENLDELPFPARHFLAMEVYFEPVFKSRNTFRLTGSRGCPYQCTFCLWTQTMYGRKVRFRDPKKIVDEIEELINKYGAKGLYFEDDTFTLIPERVIAICDEMIKRKIKIPWSCLGRVDTVTEEMLKKMKQAGCYMIRFGVESSSPEILKQAKKGISLDDIKRALKLTKDAGIETYASYTLGLPGETKQTLEDTIDFAKKLDSDYAQFGIAMPYPGTEFFNEAEKNNWLRTRDWSEYEASEISVVEYPNLTAQEISEGTKKAYRKFYLRPNYIFKRLFKVKSLNELKQLIRGALNLINRSYVKHV